MWANPTRYAKRSSTLTKSDVPRRRSRVVAWANGVASLPVRLGVALGRALRSACLLIRRPWESDLSADKRRLKAAASQRTLGPARDGATWVPSRREVLTREKRISSLVKLDTEGMLSNLYKMFFRSWGSGNPVEMTTMVERSLEERSPLLQWHLKHHSPAASLGASVRLLSPFELPAALAKLLPFEMPSLVAADPLATLAPALKPVLEPVLAPVMGGVGGMPAIVLPSGLPAKSPSRLRWLRDDARKQAAMAAATAATTTTTRTFIAPASGSGGGALASPGKGAELNEALKPIVELNVGLLSEAARRRPSAAPLIYLHAAHAGYLLGLWRAACWLRLPPGRRYALMNAFLCKVALAVAVCRAQIDAADCAEGTECRMLLEGGCRVADDDDDDPALEGGR